ncbi:MAG: plasmid replication, integration and excision activator [Actinobacteria bacterium]|nr:plasmid replication, integration and excision activator [Actinomycetota bacterium]MBI3688318.1 plasmid replication, integration and excision activator [Actinomycetota bacterium]
MAIPLRIPVRFEDVFPHGAFVLSVDASNDFERVQAGSEDVQERDKETGERMWVVRVVDGDPAARAAEVKIKIVAPVQPTPPEVLAGTAFRPAEFDGLTVTPWINTNGSRPKLGFSIRARAMRPVLSARRGQQVAS